MMDIYTRLLIMDIMISAVAIMVNILENCPINGKIHNISRILIISSIAADIIFRNCQYVHLIQYPVFLF